MLKRVLNWKTSAVGAAISTVLVILFNSFDCKVPTDWSAWLAATLPLLLGLFAKD